jgi:hypothetical protein
LFDRPDNTLYAFGLIPSGNDDQAVLINII